MGREKREEYEAVTERVSIWRRGRTWYAYYIEGGKPQRPSLHTKYVEQARRQALEIDEKLRMGLQLTSDDLEVRALFDRHMAYLQTQGRRPNTLNRYEPVFHAFTEFCEDRGVLKAGRVGVALLEDYAALRAQQGIAEATRYRETQWIKQVWKYAEERNLIPANQIKGMKLRKPRGREQPCFTESEVEMILGEARGQMCDILTVLAYTGMRRAELQWLTWTDIDLDDGWLHVCAKDGWLPKNGKDRKLPIHPRAREVFERLPHKHRWVFTARRSRSFPRGGHQVNVEHVRERLLTILKRLSIEDGGLHSFRRFFITHCANSGVSPTVLMKWVGHSDLRMILTYYRLQDKESQDAMNALGAGEDSPRLCTVYAHSGGSEKSPRSQPPVFKVVTTAG